MRIREIQPPDIECACELLLAMLKEMTSLGGHPVAEGAQAPEWLHARIVSSLDDPEHLLLLAESEEPEHRVIGIIEMSISSPHPVFKPERLLHIHSIYVDPHFRRRGTALQLMEAALRWGEDQACEAVELNALAQIPARRLYEKLGFRAFQLEMRRSL